MVSPTVDRRFGLVGNAALKAPVAAVATANIILSGQQTIDGVSLLAINAAGVPDRVLVTGQTDPTKNGIYDVSLNAWSRSADADGQYDFANGTQVLVGGGTLYRLTVWCLVALSPITVGSSSLMWQLAIGASLGNFLQSGTGAQARTFTSRERDSVSVKDFGAIGDGAQHPLSERYASLALAQVDYPFATSLTQSIDWAAFTAAIASLDDVDHYSRGGSVYVPRGKYYLSDTIGIERRITLHGDGENFISGGIYYPPTLLTFAANKTGIRIYSTLDSPSSGKDGKYAAIRNLNITSLGVGAGTGHGIWAASTFTAENVQISAFGQNGVNIVASSGATGNANLFRLVQVRASECGGYGFYIFGTDANAGILDTCDATNNQNVGFMDESFLGNTYLNCHGSGNNAASYPPFVDYKTTNINANSAFLGCYTEAGVNQIMAPGFVLGGVLAGGNAGHSTSATAVVLGGNGSVRTPIRHINEGSTAYRPYLKAGAYDASNNIFEFGLLTGPGTFYKIDYVPTGNAWFRYVLLNSLAVMSLPADLSAALRVRGPLFGEGFLVGAPGANFAQSYGPPPSNAVRGDVCWNTFGSSGTNAGWYCTVGSTSAATWRTFGTISTST